MTRGRMAHPVMPCCAASYSTWHPAPFAARPDATARADPRTSTRMSADPRDPMPPRRRYGSAPQSRSATATAGTPAAASSAGIGC
jgi:hypothetical protein